MILIIMSLIIITSYVGVMIFRNGIPYSISDTYYSLEHKVWFGFSMISTALLLIPAILDRTPESYQFLAFLMCAGLCFVGVAPNFKAGLDRPVHITATTISALCSQIWVALTQPWLLLVWIAYIIYIAVYMIYKWDGYFIKIFICTRPMFWLEVYALLTIYITLLI